MLSSIPVNSHAYIVASSSEEARNAAADTLVAGLMCSSAGGVPCGICGNCKKLKSGNHPDLRVVSREPGSGGREGREIYVSQIREIVSDAVVMPNEAPRKVYVVSDAGAMNIQAQNALLKLLEDPPGTVAVVLVADSPQKLLPTVRSRCRVIEINSGADADGECDADVRDFVKAYLRRDEAELLRGAIKRSKLDSVRASEFLSASVEYAGVLLKEVPDGETMGVLFELIGRLRTASDYLKNNVSVKLVFFTLISAGRNEVKF